MFLLFLVVWLEPRDNIKRNIILPKSTLIILCRVSMAKYLWMRWSNEYWGINGLLKEWIRFQDSWYWEKAIKMQKKKNGWNMKQILFMKQIKLMNVKNTSWKK